MHQGRKVYRFFSVIIYTILALVAVVCILPLLHVLFASFSDPATLQLHRGIILWPLGNFTLKGYELVLSNSKIYTGYINTIFYVTAGTTLGIFLTLMGGYVLSRQGFFWKKPIMMFITFTMLFNGGMIPFYLVINSLGWIDSPLAIIVPGCLSVFNIIIMRTSMLSIPASLYECSFLDGANHFQFFFKIMIPLSKPTTAALVVFSAVAQWNSWFNAMLFLKSKKLFPLQLVIREILVENKTTNLTTGAGLTASDISRNLYHLLLQYSTAVVATLPILFIYPFLQKYFVKGMMIGSLKE